METEITELEKRIHYHFQNVDLIDEALSHSSYANEKKKGRNSNERLEFLGDSVLSVVVSQYLFEHYKELPEGELTKIRAALVCEKSLHKFALKIGLGDFLLLGKGEEHTGGRERPSILADAFEAVIAAVYLDGGLEPARTHILHFIPKTIPQNHAVLFGDYKTALQEVIQKNPPLKLTYADLNSSGPDHMKSFESAALIDGKIYGRGTGRSKKAAEQEAARKALQKLGELA